MRDSNHYDTLDVSPTATLAEIKQAYRRLVKLFHPDSNLETADHERIIRINAAYEILSDKERRQSYDKHLSHQSPRHERTDWAQKQYHAHRQTGHNADEQLQRWLKQVYVPVNRLLCRILNPLAEQLEQLSADPFDDELMEVFQAYVAECRHHLQQAKKTFASQANPPVVAGAAAHLYYCLNQVGDGIDELEFFTLNYDDHYLHTGQELFRIANGLRWQAQMSISNKE